MLRRVTLHASRLVAAHGQGHRPNATGSQTAAPELNSNNVDLFDLDSSTDDDTHSAVVSSPFLSSQVPLTTLRTLLFFSLP